MSRLDDIVTETWRNKNFEEEFVKKYFKDVSPAIARARRYPCLEYLKDAYTAARGFVDDLVYSNNNLGKLSKNVDPFFRDMQLLLFGDPRKIEVISIAMRYNVRLVRTRKRYEIMGGAMILEKIADKLFLVKQYAYQQGLLFPKPMERKFGMDAVQDIAEQ